MSLKDTTREYDPYALSVQYTSLIDVQRILYVQHTALKDVHYTYLYCILSEL